jgi:hypothetical protein
MTVKGIPDGSSAVMPRLFCRDVAGEIEFCRSTFGAMELRRRPGPDGTAAHALMTIGPAMIRIEAEWPELASRAPKPDGSSPVVVFVLCPGCGQNDGAGSEQGREGLSPGAEPVLGRPQRVGYGSFRARMDDCHSHRRNY